MRLTLFLCFFLSVLTLFASPFSKLSTAASPDTVPVPCIPPPDVTVHCNAFDSSLWAYSFATFDVNQNPCVDSIYHQADYALFNTQCTEGEIVRTFFGINCFDDTAACTQRISVLHEQNFAVKFPNDTTVLLCNASNNYGEVQLFNVDCEQMNVFYTDEIITIVPDACYKIERTWNVINTCKYNQNLPCRYVVNPNSSNLGIIVSNILPDSMHPFAATTIQYYNLWNDSIACYTYKQIIKVIDGQYPIVRLFEPDCDISANDSLFWNDPSFWDRNHNKTDLCEGRSTLYMEANDLCAGTNIDIRYLLYLDLDGDGQQETVINSQSPPPAGMVKFGSGLTPSFAGGTLVAFDKRPASASELYRFGIKKDINGGIVHASVAWKRDSLFMLDSEGISPNLPHGTHKIKWFTEDNCGNESVDELTFTISDCKKPLAYGAVNKTYYVSENPSKTVDVHLSDLLTFAEDNCTPNDQLEFGICLDHPMAAPEDTCSGMMPILFNDHSDTIVTLSCETTGTFYVEIWVRDKAGNMDRGRAIITVLDTTGTCTNQALLWVQGNVYTTRNGVPQAMSAIEVNLDGQLPTMPNIPFLESDTTDANGAFRFLEVPILGQYTLKPSKNDDFLNGVNTYDLLLIQKHLLGEPWESPYEIIAADVNKSGTVTSSDIIELRKLILGLYPNGLPNVESWRFVLGSHVFINPDNPFSHSFPESIEVSQLLSSILYGDFRAMKVGDLDETASINATGNIEDRFGSEATFLLQNIDYQENETFFVKIKIPKHIDAYQFTLDFEDFELLDILPSAGSTLDNFAFFPKEGKLTIAVEKAGADFSLKLKAKTAGSLKNGLKMTSDLTPALAFSADGAMHKAILRFEEKGGSTSVVETKFELFQNNPNPFLDKTQFEFYLPNAGQIRLDIFDAVGRKVWSHANFFEKGRQAIALNGKDLPSTGLLVYHFYFEGAMRSGTMLRL